MPEMKLKPLSARARKLLRRLHEGRWYHAYPRRRDGTYGPPKAMKELTDHGLARLGGRHPVWQACYVPTGHLSANVEAIPPHHGDVDPAIEGAINDYLLEIHAALGAVERKIKCINALKTAHRIIR